jgi:hypothetical protein
MSKKLSEIQNNNDDNFNTFNELFIKGQTYKNVLSKKEIWKELENEYKGKLEILMTKSYDGTTLKLKIPYKNHELTFIETDTKPLKIETKLNLNSRFEFNISIEDWTDKITFLLGQKDINTEDAEFDNKYRIKSNNVESILRLLDVKIRNSILKNEIYTLNLENEKLLIVKDRNTSEKSKLNDFIVLTFSIIDNLINQGVLTIN